MCPYLMVEVWTKILEVGIKPAPIVKDLVRFVRCNKLKCTIVDGIFSTLGPYVVGLDFSSEQYIIML